jgi:flagellar motor switch protein FliN/FliY
MGTSATTLFALLRQKVLITTPKVSVVKWHEISENYDRPCVGIKVNYTTGIKGMNVLVLKENDVKIISSLMLGGDGVVDPDTSVSELDLSAISEAMNQMVGSSSTSLSTLIKEKIDIDTPNAFILDFKDDAFIDALHFMPDEVVASVSFRMEIGTLIDSEIMQVIPVEFAIDMIDSLKRELAAANEQAPAPPPPAAAHSEAAVPQQPAPEQHAAPPPQYAPPPQQYAQPPPQQMGAQQPYYPPPNQYQQPVNVQQVQFQNLDVGAVMQQKENIEIIMDVPLEVTVELGRTRKKIKEILEFVPGTIVELDRLSGESIDIMVNGKFVAKGEVVVLDENFGIRITDIIGVEKRI